MTSIHQYFAAAFEEKRRLYELTVELDQGVHRHLKFRIDGRCTYGFDVITWPGHLAISGDMGCYVFARLHDMFEFFRDAPRINDGYWAEKLQAADKIRGYEEFSPELFRQRIMDWLADEGPIDQDLLDEVEDLVLSRADDGEDEAMRAAYGFEHNGRAVFQDFFEVRCREYTFSYLWCLHAIVWAISQYDSLQEKAA